MTECDKCGLDHKRFGVVIACRNLFRHARSTIHLVKMAGGGWGFMASLLDRHPEIDDLTVQDQDTDTFYRCDRKEFERYAIRRTLDPGSGPQLILPLKYWRRIGKPSDGISLQEASQQVHPELPPQETQPHLFDSPANAQWFRKATEPRPRNRKPKRSK